MGPLFPPISSKISEEQAAQELDAWLLAIDVDGDATGMAKERARLIKAIMAGHLVFEGAEATFTPFNRASKHTNPLTFRERTGADLLVAEKYQANPLKATYALIASIVGTDINRITTLAGSDVKVVEALLGFLMA